jgi:hypothetical protein
MIFRKGSTMYIKISKKELLSLLGEEPVSLKTFTGIKWAENGMVLSTSRTLFMGSIKVKITWPCVLVEHRTNQAQIEKALTNLFAQVDERYRAAVTEKAAKEAEKAHKANA